MRKFVGSKVALGSPLSDISDVRWIKNSNQTSGTIFALDFVGETSMVIMTCAQLKLQRAFLGTTCYVVVRRIESFRMTYEWFSELLSTESNISCVFDRMERASNVEPIEKFSTKIKWKI